MPRPTPTRVVAGVLALGGATAVGLVAYDQLGRETFAAEPPLTSALPRDETLHIECVRRPLLGELWGIGRQPAGLIQGAPPAGAWWAPLPRAGRLRVLDERWAVVELTEQPVPCSEATVTIEDDGWVPPPPVLEPFAHARPRVLSGMVEGCTTMGEPHLANESGLARPTTEHDTSPVRPRTLCVVEIEAGLLGCAELAAQPRDLAVVDRSLLAVYRAAEATVAAWDLEDGALRWSASVPTEAADLWFQTVTHEAIGLRANETYFRVALATGALTPIGPAGADVCNVGRRAALLADGELWVSGADPFALTLAARPGPAFRLETCDGDTEGSFVVRAGVPAYALTERAALPVEDPMVPFGTPGLATYTFAATHELALAVFSR